MKVVILKGTPRVYGNSNLLVERFVKGAEEAGHEIIEFDCSKHKVGGCRENLSLECGNVGILLNKMEFVN